LFAPSFDEEAATGHLVADREKGAREIADHHRELIPGCAKHGHPQTFLPNWIAEPDTVLGRENMTRVPALTIGPMTTAQAP
jgi:hypothetical protein